MLQLQVRPFEQRRRGECCFAMERREIDGHAATVAYHGSTRDEHITNSAAVG